MAVSWPLGVPQRFSMSAEFGAPTNAFVATSFDKGSNSRRRNTLGSEEPMTITIVAITGAQFMEFRDWFRLSLGAGAEEFEMLHPIDNSVRNWVFMDPSNAYSAVPAGDGFFDVTMMLGMRP